MNEQDYNVCPPPRNVSLLAQGQAVFGGALSQFGWLSFGFGLIFFWTFVLEADFSSFYLSRDDLQTAKGVVVSNSETNYEVNDAKIRETRYTFKTDGKEYQGVSYKAGCRLGRGAPVTVEYPKGHPGMSTIPGQRRAPFGPWAAFVAVFPLAGLAMVVYAVRQGLRMSSLLADGQLALGKLKSKVPTNGTVNDRPIYKMVYEFTAGYGGTSEAVAKTHRPELLEAQELQGVVYDPNNPSDALLVADMPGRPRFTTEGVRPASARGALAVLAIPGATIIGHGTYVLMRIIG